MGREFVEDGLSPQGAVLGTSRKEGRKVQASGVPQVVNPSPEKGNSDSLAHLLGVLLEGLAWPNPDPLPDGRGQFYTLWPRVVHISAAPKVDGQVTLLAPMVR